MAKAMKRILGFLLLALAGAGFIAYVACCVWIMYVFCFVDDYLVFYVVKEKEVEIRRIIHGRRRYEFLI